VELAGRNRMMRYMAIQAIKQDPAWMGGDYQTEPMQGLRTATELLMIMGSSPLQMQKQAPTRELAEEYVDQYLKRAETTDANNMLFYLNASRNYNPSAHLDRITVPLLWINSADDFINPPELGIAEKMVHQMPNARFVLLPITDATRGHSTHTQAAIWKDYLSDLLQRSEPK
jgi:homoserine O-acetyltransferase